MAKDTKPADVRLKSADQLQGMLLDLRREQFNLRFQRATGQTEGVGRVKQVRRDIARVKTIMTEQKRASSTSAEPKRAPSTSAEPKRAPSTSAEPKRSAANR